MWKKCFLFHFQISFQENKFSCFRYSNFMTSWNASVWNKKYILLNIFGQFMSYCKRKNVIKKNSAETWTWKNWFQTFLRLQIIKHNLYYKMKFLKESTYIRYVLAKPSKFFKIVTLTSSDSFLLYPLKN